jgi:hypothetical protein
MKPGRVAGLSEVHHDVCMMTRTQLYMDREMLRRARTKASQLGISLAEYVRRLVAEDLGELGSRVDPNSLFDLGASAGSDVAAEKDAMLGEALGRTAR